MKKKKPKIDGSANFRTSARVYFCSITLTPFIEMPSSLLAGFERAQRSCLSFYYTFPSSVIHISVATFLVYHEYLECDSLIYIIIRLRF